MEGVALAGLSAFCRTGGCFMVLPGLSSGNVPIQVRLYMVLAIAVSVAALMPGQIPVSADGASLVRLIALETGIGVTIGLLGRFAIMALSFGATAIATVTGYGNIPGAVMEPTEPQAVLGTLVTFSALIVLFQLDFHHAVIRALVGSYQVMPPGNLPSAGLLLEDVSKVLDQLFSMVLRLIGPFIAYALLANATIGLVNKLAPQIPIYFVSLPALIFGGLLLLYVVVPGLFMQFAEGFLALYSGG